MRVGVLVLVTEADGLGDGVKEVPVNPLMESLAVSVHEGPLGVPDEVGVGVPEALAVAVNVKVAPATRDRVADRELESVVVAVGLTVSEWVGVCVAVCRRPRDALFVAVGDREREQVTVRVRVNVGEGATSLLPVPVGVVVSVRRRLTLGLVVSDLKYVGVRSAVSVPVGTKLGVPVKETVEDREAEKNCVVVREPWRVVLGDGETEGGLHDAVGEKWRVSVRVAVRVTVNRTGSDRVRVAVKDKLLSDGEADGDGVWDLLFVPVGEVVRVKLVIVPVGHLVSVTVPVIVLLPVAVGLPVEVTERLMELDGGEALGGEGVGEVGVGLKVAVVLTE